MAAAHAAGARGLVAAAAAVLAVVSATSAGAAPTPRMTLSPLPATAHQGKQVSVGVKGSGPGALCSITVRYADGESQKGLLPTRSLASGARWSWTVPQTAAVGRAQVAASCAGRAAVKRPLTIVGSLLPPKITVRKDGFTVRQRPVGGSTVSYGLLLANESRNVDALDVSVLLNFVMADNRLIGTKTMRVPAIGAGSTYALGGSMAFPGAAPVERLEVVITVKGRQPAGLRLPAIANVRVVGSPTDKGFVGSVEGEVVNDKDVTLERASLSVVLFDARGAIVGGGSGFAFATLPPGTRQFFKVASGVEPVPVERAVSAQVSVDPAWRAN